MQATEAFIDAFSVLGKFYGQFSSGQRQDTPGLVPLNNTHFESLKLLIEGEEAHNPWFTADNVRQALAGISAMLERTVLEKWLSPYGDLIFRDEGARTVGLVLAGNIPMVGFHDLLCVLAAGHRAVAKPSSKDDRLLRNMGMCYP